MPIIEFPPVDIADEQGLLAIGGDLHHDSLLLAYQSGIFPWPISEEYPLAWFSPPQRGVILQENIRFNRSLKKFVKKCNWKISFNQDFLGVIKECQKVHAKSNDGTWITDEIIDGYYNFFHQGLAYSVEVKNENGDLIGGLYGVKIGHFLSGESMFFKETNASKLALLGILSILIEEGIPFLDTQMVTPITESFGATEIPRIDFIKAITPLFNKGTLNLPTTSIKASELAIKLSF
ncbi:leucyltransferase [Halobacteriovorax sp. BALOs_7]|uniref:leucyl/phenylalanyl-tRNA--protein transferase n=1 Tax=unclassified Halobacteriovorax TaxID=2639665 RepID=UPI000EA24230|nr:leucyl/phenylalanyl-tRNA--protein transferase [Halobacteriovorax sp. BALOs_7]AYF44906.1 leucyltransferase [Halobacteriovorax sp. BALOs_7]